MIVMPPVFNSGDTIYFFFDTYSSAGASITITGLATTDIEVYKNGSVTQRSSDSGYALLDTDGIDFDGATGLHGFSIDTSDNTDSGFWTDGAQYLVHVNAITVDSQTVRFSYMLTLGYLLRPTTAGRKLDVSTGGEAGLDWANVGTPGSTVSLSATTVATVTTTTTATNLTNAPTNGDLTSTMKASVNAEVDAAIETYHLDHLLAATYDPASKPGAADALLNELVENDGGVSRYTANALEQAPTGGSAPTAADIADAVWEEAIADHSGTVGSTAEALSDAGGAGTPPTAEEIADAVLDEAMSGHTTAGTLGKAVADILDDTGTAGVVVASGSKTGYSLASTGMDSVTLPANIITASAIASDAIGDAEVATDVVDAIAAAVWAVVIDHTYTAKEVTRAIAATTAGASSGGPGSPVYKSLDGSTTRVSGTANSSGDRSSITYNL